MLSSDPQVPCRGIKRLMAQQQLDRPDIDPRFEPVRRKTVARVWIPWPCVMPAVRFAC